MIKAVAAKVWFAEARLIIRGKCLLKCGHKHRSMLSAERCAKAMLKRNAEWLKGVWEERRKNERRG